MGNRRLGAKAFGLMAALLVLSGGAPVASSENIDGPQRQLPRSHAYKSVEYRASTRHFGEDCDVGSIACP
jgi:hypothetical protein